MSRQKMATLNGMEASIRAVLETAKNHGMSFRRVMKVVNDGEYCTTIFCSARLISLVFDSDQDNEDYEDDEDNEESGSGADSNDEEEAGDVEAITTPSTGGSKRKALNFIPNSSTPSKSKNMYYMSSPHTFLLIFTCRAEAQSCR